MAQTSKSQEVTDLYSAVCDFTAKKKGDLSFCKGETLHVLQREGQWWHAKNQGGHVGFVPSNLLQNQHIYETRLPSRPRSSPNPNDAQCVDETTPTHTDNAVITQDDYMLALHDSKAEKIGDLGFTKGDRLLILSRKGNWWFARNESGKEGFVPSNLMMQNHYEMIVCSPQLPAPDPLEPSEPPPDHDTIHQTSVNRDEILFRNLAKELGTEWEELATVLGLTYQRLLRIKLDNRQLDIQIFAMLVEWKQQSGQLNETELARALKKVGRNDLVRGDLVYIPSS